MTRHYESVISHYETPEHVNNTALWIGDIARWNTWTREWHGTLNRRYCTMKHLNTRMTRQSESAISHDKTPEHVNDTTVWIGHIARWNTWTRVWHGTPKASITCIMERRGGEYLVARRPRHLCGSPDELGPWGEVSCVCISFPFLTLESSWAELHINF